MFEYTWSVELWRLHRAIRPRLKETTAVRLRRPIGDNAMEAMEAMASLWQVHLGLLVTVHEKFFPGQIGVVGCEFVNGSLLCLIDCLFVGVVDLVMGRAGAGPLSEMVVLRARYVLPAYITHHMGTFRANHLITSRLLDDLHFALRALADQCLAHGLFHQVALGNALLFRGLRAGLGDVTSRFAQATADFLARGVLTPEFSILLDRSADCFELAKRTAVKALQSGPSDFVFLLKGVELLRQRRA